MSKDISNKVLKEIKKKNIKPKPKWEFLLKNYVLWGAFGLSIFIGGAAMSVAIFRLVNNEWDIYNRLGHNMFTFTVSTLPYFWLLILGVFIFVAYYNFKHTNKGYSHRLPLVIILSVLLSIVLGFALFGVKVAQRIDEQALHRLPFYKEMTLGKKEVMWSQPEMGLIGGKILEIEMEMDLIKLEDFIEENWNIHTIKIPPQVIEKFNEGMIVGVMGEFLEKGEFMAEDIRLWKGNFIGNGVDGLPKMKENFQKGRIR